MIKVGVTGGIGSGKSIACEVFARLGINIYNADDRAKALMNTSLLIKQKLIDKFGTEVYKNNQLNKPFLANIIFNNKTAIEFVNSIVHPEVARDFTAWCIQYETEPYVIEEAALLFESGACNHMDKIITVYAPADLRVKRVMQRDNISGDQVIRRMNNQLSDEEKIKHSDYVIYNNDKTSILEQILKFHTSLSKY